MVVQITNITDGPGKSPIQVDIYNKTLGPGVSIRLPAELIDKKVRKLEEQGLIAIGRLPPWYESSKARKGRSLSPEEMQKRIVQAPAPKETSIPMLSAPKEELTRPAEFKQVDWTEVVKPSDQEG